jgi:hypothetical protein
MSDAPAAFYLRPFWLQKINKKLPASGRLALGCKEIGLQPLFRGFLAHWAGPDLVTFYLYGHYYGDGQQTDSSQKLQETI